MSKETNLKGDDPKNEELTEAMITSIMEDFDFATVHKTMAMIGWTWRIEGVGDKVPSVYRLIKMADKLLHEVAKYYGKEEFYVTSSDGFTASLDSGTLALQFVLTESTACAEDYIDKEEDAG